MSGWIGHILGFGKLGKSPGSFLAKQDSRCVPVMTAHGACPHCCGHRVGSGPFSHTNPCFSLFCVLVNNLQLAMREGAKNHASFYISSADPSFLLALKPSNQKRQILLAITFVSPRPPLSTAHSLLPVLCPCCTPQSALSKCPI
jgi:hypothetical protein